MNTNHNPHNMMKDVHMNFSQLECLVALADAGSFTEAAFKVNLTQSAVSHALAALENELGVMLVERNRKGVVALTTTGAKILPHVRAMLTHSESIVQEAKAAQGLATGRLRVGNTLCLCPGLLVSVLTQFQKQYPDVDVVLFEGSMQEVGEWIESSIVDVGFVPLSADDIDTTLITTDELVVVVAPGHPLSQQSTVVPQQLINERFVMSKNECSFQMMEQAGIDSARFRSNIRYHASDSATIVAMVREGLGITLMPRLMLPVNLEGVVALSLNPFAQLPIGLAIRARETTSPAAKLFVQTALAWTQEQVVLTEKAG